jgi:hypothetical protein
LIGSALRYRSGFSLPGPQITGLECATDLGRIDEVILSHKYRASSSEMLVCIPPALPSLAPVFNSISKVGTIEFPGSPWEKYANSCDSCTLPIIGLRAKNSEPVHLPILRSPRRNIGTLSYQLPAPDRLPSVSAAAARASNESPSTLRSFLIISIENSTSGNLRSRTPSEIASYIGDKGSSINAPSRGNHPTK